MQGQRPNCRSASVPAIANPPATAQAVRLRGRRSGGRLRQSLDIREEQINAQYEPGSILIG